jgi:TRAP-type C4-dicarboxylate transport system substrate-binding protein
MTGDKTMHSPRALTALALAAALVAAAPAQAQEKKLKFAHTFPATHFLYVEGAKVFEDKVTQATNGRIKFDSYHAGQLGKEGSAMLASGIADAALLIPSYEAAKLPLTSVAELPGLYGSSCEGTAKLWNIIKDGGPLNDAEYKPKGIKVLYVGVLPPYQVMTTGKQVGSMKDMAGLKIRANGAAMDKTVQAVGAVPVRVPSPELYDALTRGTVDGAYWPIGSTKAMGLEKVLHHLAKGPQLGGGSTVFAMSMKAWDALSPQDKAVFTQAAAETQKSMCTWMDKADEEAEVYMVKEYKLAVTPLAKEDVARWQERFTPIANDWAKEMDSTGRPGSALLKAFREAPAQ